MYDLNEVLAEFGIIGNVLKYGNGHINDTYITEDRKYLMQKINSDVFPNPAQVMANISGVTKHLRKKITAAGGNARRETLTIVQTLDGHDYHVTHEGDYFRVYLFIENTSVYHTINKPENFYDAARAFGRFQRMLDDYPADTLFEVIKDFHNTPARYNKFVEAVNNDRYGRAHEISREIEFIYERAPYAQVITGAIKSGRVPLRVTHNNTKISNILVDNVTDTALCIIDLDTVMPGSMLFDFGTSICFGANTAAESEKDLSKVSCDMELFEQFVIGFAKEMAADTTHDEKDLLALSPIVMAFELGLRYLTDYLNGDCYFKITESQQNLIRGRVLLQLVKDMENHLLTLTNIVKRYL